MKVAKLETMPLAVPIDFPFLNPRAGWNDKIKIVITKLTTDDGLEGFGVNFTWVDRQIKSLRASIEDLGGVIIGQDVMRHAEAWQKLYNATLHMGHQGHGIYAVGGN